MSRTENFQSEYRKRARSYDILVDFQTGGNFPVLVRYIYKFVTKCDGAQMQASVFYIPTLVALSGLLSQFVTLDWVTDHVMGQVTCHRPFLSLSILFMFVYICLVT